MTPADLRQLVADAATEDLPALAGRLREAELLVEMRLRTAPANGNGHAETEPARLLTVDEAAGIAGVPPKRIYEWARRGDWACRPTKRCLRINEPAFRRWLARPGRP